MYMAISNTNTMLVYTYISPGKFELIDKPKPELQSPRDAIVRITLGSICTSDLHIKHGSVPRAVPSLKWSDKRNNLVSEYTAIEGDKLVMTSDKTFASPSTAADFCIGSSNNGWLVWKDKDGNTLDSVYRKQLE